MVQSESFPKKNSLMHAALWILCNMLSIVSGMTVAWDRTFSRSLSDQPEPFSALRWRTMASLVPDEVKGEGFPSITVQKLLGVSGRSQVKLP